MQIVITGHRPQKLAGSENWVKQQLDQTVRRALLRYSINATFITGGALGVDQWFSEIVLSYGGRLMVVKPFPSHGKNWSKEMQERYKEICAKAMETFAVSEDPYSVEKLYRRNIYMLAMASCVVAVWNPQLSGGTTHCVGLAQQWGRPIYHINPAARTATWVK